MVVRFFTSLLLWGATGVAMLVIWLVSYPLGQAISSRGSVASIVATTLALPVAFAIGGELQAYVFRQLGRLMAEPQPETTLSESVSIAILPGRVWPRALLAWHCPLLSPMCLVASEDALRTMNTAQLTELAKQQPARPHAGALRRLLMLFAWAFGAGFLVVAAERAFWPGSLILAVAASTALYRGIVKAIEPSPADNVPTPFLAPWPNSLGASVWRF